MQPEPKASNLSPIYMTNTLSNRALLPVNFIKVTLPLPNSPSYCPLAAGWHIYSWPVEASCQSISCRHLWTLDGGRHCTQATAVLLHCGHYVTNRALAISKVARVSFFHFDVSSSQSPTQFTFTKSLLCSFYPLHDAMQPRLGQLTPPFLAGLS